MSEFHPEKLHVKYKDNLDEGKVDEIRRYTLTHSDETGELFLTIAKEYDYEKFNEIRDEVIGEWIKEEGINLLNIDLLVGLGSNFVSAKIRDEIFRKELPLALKAIVHGDKKFLENNKELYESVVRVNFKSEVDQFDKVEEWGKVKDHVLNINDDNNMLVDNTAYRNIKQENLLQSVLIKLLSTHIRTELNIQLGREATYCMDSIDILGVVKKGDVEYLPNMYEVTIGVKVGKPTPNYNNIQMTFLIKDTVIITNHIKKI